MPLTLSGNGTISDLASAPTVGGTALPTNLSDLGIANHNQITVDSSGRIDSSTKPCVVITRLGASYHFNAGDNLFSTTDVSTHLQQGGLTRDLSTGRFTAPVAGQYYVGFYTICEGSSGSSSFQCQVNDTLNDYRDFRAYHQNTESAWNTMAGFSILNLSANDYVTITCSDHTNSGGHAHGRTHMKFIMYLI